MGSPEKKPEQQDSRETVHTVAMVNNEKANNEFDVYGDEESAESTSVFSFFPQIFSLKST